MAFQGDSIFWVEVEKVVPNPYQPRREFDEAKLKELAESVRMYGILQPLTVTRKEIQRDDGAFYTEYELIAGERRLRASKLAGLAQVPVIIRDSDDSEQEKLELAIIENLQREDLNAVDRALAFQQLAETFGMTHTEVAKKVGRSRMYVSNTIRLLGLPAYMLDSLKVGDITEGHARTLLMLNDRAEEQDVVYREILLKKLSVREVERIVRKIATDKVRKKVWKGSDPVLLEFEKEFTDVLGTRVFINKTDYGGKVTIDYFSEDDLQKLLKLVKQQPAAADSLQADGEASLPVVQTMAAVSAAVPLEVVTDADVPTETSAQTPPATEEKVAVTENELETETASETKSAAGFMSELENQQPNSEPSIAAATEAVNDELGTDEHDTVAEDDAADIDTSEAIASVERSSDAIEDYVIERAEAAGANAFRPTAEEKAVISAETQQTIQSQINTLAEKELNPPSTTPQPEKPKDDDSDLYSMRGFSL